jgi:hypothetical protein
VINPSPSNHPYDLVEQQLHEVSALLARDDAPAFELACARLQAICVELRQAQERDALPETQVLARRLAIWQPRLTAVREQLSRRSAQLQQSVQVLVPAPASATYAGAGLASAATPFGPTLRQSGSLRGMAA